MHSSSLPLSSLGPFFLLGLPTALCLFLGRHAPSPFDTLLQASLARDPRQILLLHLDTHWISSLFFVSLHAVHT